MSLPGGGVLFEAGAPADAVYFVVSGCLGVYGPGGELIRRIAAGETVGEMGLIIARRRTASVRALRDSELATLSAATFERVLLGHPEAILRLARIAVTRLADREAEQGPADHAAHFRAGPAGRRHRHARNSRPARGRAVALRPRRRSSTGSERSATARNGSTSANRRTTSSCMRPTPATRRGRSFACARPTSCCSRRARPAAMPPGPPRRWLTAACATRSSCSCMRAKSRTARPTRWHAALPGIAHHHLRAPADYERVVRLLTGRAVGLVLSGGGARGFAHLGVVRALREHGVPIDLVGGTSMGAILAAGVASEWGHEELVQRFKRCFVDTNPLSDYTLPLVSLVSGRKVSMLLRRELGDIDIEDLPLPFFCVSSNLTTRPHCRAPAGHAVAVAARLGRDPGRAAAGIPGRRGLRRRRRNEHPARRCDAREGPRPGDRSRRQQRPRVHDRRSKRPRRRRSGTCCAGAAAAGARTSSRSSGGPAWSTARPRSSSAACRATCSSPRRSRSLDLLDWKGFERAIEIGYRDACERLEAGALEQLAKVYASGTLS